MPSTVTRRRILQSAGAASLASLLPRAVFSQGAASHKAAIYADWEIGTIRPELHSHFAEHLGSCVYGGIWVGKNSPIPNINGYRQAAVDYLKELGVPVLRWPGGCFADDYHWRDGVSVSASRLGNEMIVTFVNPRHDTDMQSDCALHGVTARQGSARILHDPDLNAANGFDNPDRVTIKPHAITVEGGRIALTLPALSIVTATVETA